MRFKRQVPDESEEATEKVEELPPPRVSINGLANGFKEFKWNIS